MNDSSSITESQTTEPNASRKIDVKLVIDLLTHEINFTLQREKRPGWSLWAILGTLAAAGWLLINQFETTRFNSNIATFVLSLSLVLDALYLIHSSLSPSTLSTARPRFQFSSVLGESRSVMLVELLRYLVLLYISMNVPQLPTKSLRVLTYSYLGFAALMIFVGLIMSFLKLPIYPNRSYWVNYALRVLSVVVSIFLLISAWNYFLPVYSMTSFPQIADFRISLLIIAIVFLFTSLLRTRETPLLSTLVEIRRDLVFGNGEIESLVRRADIALAGMGIAEVLQEPVKNILDFMERVSEETVSASKEYESAAALFPKDPYELTKSKFEDAKALVQSTNKRLLIIQKLISRIRRRLRFLWMRVDTIERVSPESSTEIRSVLEKIVSASKLLIANVDEMSSKSQSLHNAIDTSSQALHEVVTRAKATKTPDEHEPPKSLAPQ